MLGFILSAAIPAWAQIDTAVSSKRATADIPNPNNVELSGILDDILTQASNAGSYQFTADIAQTLIPQAAASTIGATSEQIDTHLEGNVVLPDDMQLRLAFEGSGNAEDAMRIV